MGKHQLTGKPSRWRMTTERDRLIATTALLQTAEVRGFRASLDAANAAWEKAEAFVAAMEAEPDKPVKCPCCDKLVTLCVKHYQLHEPGKKCAVCREDG